MAAVARRILVVGGNGFVGSAVCKAALARGMQVTSISSSGKPYRTPKGHAPAWTSKVDWRAGDALQPASYAHLLPGVHAVVHTIGILFEDTRYKSALAKGNVPELMAAIAASVGFGGAQSNPLKERDPKSSYDAMNRDSAMRVCEAFISSNPGVQMDAPRPFVYLSAEDCGRPFIPARYIETKREAEQELEKMTAQNPNYKGVYMRPTFIYHPHNRPLTSPVAALADLSATIHAKAPPALPTPAKMLRYLASSFPPQTSSQPLVAPSSLDSMANALTIPPIHVDHVAEAVCVALDPARTDVRGVVDLKRMRELIGWSEKGEQSSGAERSQDLR
ncbi:NAD-P-binding protein [Obba rivulosa]|uniref:NAD-P-binding protein n=1 Tax=Obba rivulosa TaxID=1052685 RepID=A0A8E2J4Y4_9APHY|nr:NAD-P-binding protein [Obba rivulosa]